MFLEGQIEHWRLLRDEMLSTDQYRRYQTERVRKRVDVRAAILKLLSEFLNNMIKVDEFRATFDRKTRTEWNVFGIKGLSGAMFLNILVKHIPDQAEMVQQLKTVLTLPRDVDTARQQLQTFDRYLSELIEAQVIGRRQLQPTRLSFFVSAFWHMQDTEKWPIFYLSGRQALESEGLYQPTNDPVEDYFAFRNVFIEMSKALDLNAWDLEYLFVWQREQTVPTSPIAITAQHESTLDSMTVTATAQVGDINENEDPHSEITHTQIQLLLAKIGKKLGCNIWVASNDRNRIYDGERLGDYSLDVLPPYIVADSEAQKIIELIDILWLIGKRGVAAAFEIEHTTSIFSGLLRLSDLITLQPNISFPLYIVTSTDRVDKVRKQLSRPTFQALQLHESCGFFAYEDLIREASNIMRWAKKPDAINELAEYVPNVLDR